MDSPKRTVSPIPPDLVQRILDQLGYDLVFHDHTTERLHFRRARKPTVKVHNATTNPPEWVTICKPDHQCDGHKGSVYDRDYVVDLINKINGHIGGDSGTNLLVLLAEEKATH